MRTSKSSRLFKTVAIGAFGGITGGIAEIGWIGLYGMATGIPVDPVARGITRSMIPALAISPWSAEFGILIHLILAVALGIGLALIIAHILSRPAPRHLEFALTMLILTSVWAVNFFILLPRINPAFVHLLPYSVTLLSKLLFGVAAAITLNHAGIRVQCRDDGKLRRRGSRLAIGLTAHGALRSN